MLQRMIDDIKDSTGVTLRMVDCGPALPLIVT